MCRLHKQSNGTNARMGKLMEFIIGVLAGVLGSQLFEIGRDWYIWYTYRDNIIAWEDSCKCGDSWSHGE